MNRASDVFTLGNDYKIPCLGFGTWQIPDGNTAVTAVRKALETGYRHIDAAAIYGNEAGVGRGIAESGLNRADLFVTSKVWNAERGYDKTRLAFEKSVSNLQLDYLDLYGPHLLLALTIGKHQSRNLEGDDRALQDGPHSSHWRIQFSVASPRRSNANGSATCGQSD